MTDDDPTPPVADDDFPEFAGPPRAKPARTSPARAQSPEAGSADNPQAAVDEVIARIRQRKVEGDA